MSPFSLPLFFGCKSILKCALVKTLVSEVIWVRKVWGVQAPAGGGACRAHHSIVIELRWAIAPQYIEQFGIVLSIFKVSSPTIQRDCPTMALREDPHRCCVATCLQNSPSCSLASSLLRPRRPTKVGRGQRFGLCKIVGTAQLH